MSGKLQSTAALEESSEQPNQFLSSNHNNNPFLNIIASFTELFNLVFHPQKKEKNQAGEDSAAVNKVKTEPEPEPEPVIVRFPLAKIESVPPLTLEREEQNTNSLVLWQVYAIGGLLVLRWGWTMWNERRTRKKPSDEQPSDEQPSDDQPSDDQPPPAP